MAVSSETAAGTLRPLAIRGLPPLYNEMGIVSLRGRSYSPMAEYAVDFLGTLAAASS